MTFPKARLVVSAVLFISWLGFLFYLVLETNTVVISRPQLLIAQAVIVVQVRDDHGRPDPMVTVKEVLRDDGELKPLVGRDLRLGDLIGCGKDQGYGGAGEYVIPLMRRGNGWQIAPIPLVGHKHPSHGTLLLWDVGLRPDCVLDGLLEYAREKPAQADDLLGSLIAVLAARSLGPWFFGPTFDWRAGIGLPRGMIGRRLPIEDAYELQTRLNRCGARVDVSAEELRIYPWIPEVREQVKSVLAGK